MEHQGGQSAPCEAPGAMLDGPDHPIIDPSRIDGVVFDTDGVVTDTAATHANAWKRLFDEYLEERSQRLGEPFVPFDADGDYRRYVDGRPREDGVRGFLGSRGIVLPEGEPSDPPAKETVIGLGTRKDGYFLEDVRKRGVAAYPSSIELVRALRARGIRAAVVSASKNMRRVLAAAGVPDDLFDVRVDGTDAKRLGLAGKPSPELFLEAAARLGVEPARAAVVEDAIAGVEAGRRGGFGLVVGVDRSRRGGSALREAGADAVVGDLAELSIATGA